MLNAYNNIARYYSSLASILFGKSILNIQLKLIQHLPTKGSLLILGGGNGKILPHIFQHAPNLQIEYLEASSSMITIAKKEAPPLQNITYNHNSSFSAHAKGYDAILCSFFFDQFSEAQIAEILNKLHHQHTQWFVADFSLNEVSSYKFIRVLQIKLSILFFKIVSKHRLNYLPNVFDTFQQNGFKTLFSDSISSGFYRLQVFHR